jgi:hypothetical protein
LFPILRQLVRIGASHGAFVSQRRRPRHARPGRRRDLRQRPNFLSSLGIIRRPG